MNACAMIARCARYQVDPSMTPPEAIIYGRDHHTTRFPAGEYLPPERTAHPDFVPLSCEDVA